jgi:hypothetical protein
MKDRPKRWKKDRLKLPAVVSNRKVKEQCERRKDSIGSLFRRCLSAESRKDWNMLTMTKRLAVGNSSEVEVGLLDEIEVLEEHHRLQHLAHDQR